MNKDVRTILKELIYAQAGDLEGTMPIEIGSLDVAIKDISDLILREKPTIFGINLPGNEYVRGKYDCCVHLAKLVRGYERT